MTHHSHLTTISLAAVLSAFACPAPAATLPQPPVAPAPSISADTLTILVLDDSGNPVPNARIGNHLKVFCPDGLSHLPPDYVAGLTDHARAGRPTPMLGGQPGPRTDTAGIATASRVDLLVGRPENSLVAIDAAGGRLAIGKVSAMLTQTSIELRLQPACRVRVSMSTELAPDARPEWSYLYAHAGELRPLACGPGKGVHEFWLPPGEYRLECYGKDTYDANPTLTVAPGQREAELAVTLPPSRIATLRGRPAPEFAKIKAWKNAPADAPPPTLASLRGRVVILDFWGYWCGPCCQAMPELMAWHDELADRGLVIIAVHDDSVATVEEMDERLTTTRTNLWNGRELPFLVAIDGGGKTPVPGASFKANGATTAAYGVDIFPTTILIDREGNVVDQIGTSPDDLARVRQLLDAP